MTTSTTVSTVPEHDERLRTVLARLCMDLVAQPGDDLSAIVQRAVYRHFWPLPSITTVRLLLVLHAAALRAPSEAWLRVETVAEAAKAVQNSAETDGCRDECDDDEYLDRTGLACRACSGWPHAELDQAVTALVHFVQREVSPTALDGITS